MGGAAQIKIPPVNTTNNKRSSLLLPMNAKNSQSSAGGRSPRSSPRNSNFPIFIKLPKVVGNQKELNVKSKETVGDLQKKIAKHFGIPIDCQQLLFAQKPLIPRSK
eukprot:UN28045